MRNIAKWKKWLIYIGLGIFLIGLGLFIWVSYKARDRHPGYTLQELYESTEDRSLSIGFSAYDISPEVPDTWEDVNGDAQYKEADGDTYADRNANGKI